MGVKVLYVPNSPWTQGPITHGMVVQGLATVKWPSALRTRQFGGTGSPQTGQFTHFCSAIMGVKVLYVPNSPWTQGPGTYSTFTPIIAEQKCVYGPVWGDPVPPNCRVLKADGHFTVARTLYYPYHELWVPGSKGYFGTYSTFTPIIAEQKCVYGPVWGDPVPQTAASLRRMVILR